MALEVTNSNITEVLAQNEITVLQFSAEWCGPCRILGPIIEELAAGNEGISIGKVNVDENGELGLTYSVRGIPTIIFFKNGEVVEKIVGVKSKAELQAKIDSLKA
jgi:thioredoxin 1